jgi:hypothetical protein
LPSTLELDGQELDWFTGKPISTGKRNKQGESIYHHTNCKRVELNAMSAGQFIKFIEAGIDDYLAGEDRKLIPPDDVLNLEWDKAVATKLQGKVVAEILHRLDVSGFIRQLAKKINHRTLPKAVKAHVDIHQANSWRDAVGTLVDVELQQQYLSNEIATFLKQKLGD